MCNSDNNTNTNYSFKRTLYSYDKLDSTKFCNMLSRIDWADAMQNGSIDDCAEHFNTIFFEAACNCMPVKKKIQFALKMLLG